MQEFVARRPDLLILDIRMPGMDGLEVLTKVLAEDRRIPVILSSAYSTYKDSFLSWSADAYVLKSSDLTELLETVSGLLSRGDSARGHLEYQRDAASA
jgi:DNA-binding response OmpR family regulator